MKKYQNPLELSFRTILALIFVFCGSFIATFTFARAISLTQPGYAATLTPVSPSPLPANPDSASTPPSEIISLDTIAISPSANLPNQTSLLNINSILPDPTPPPVRQFSDLPITSSQPSQTSHSASPSTPSHSAPTTSPNSSSHRNSPLTPSPRHDASSNPPLQPFYHPTTTPIQSPPTPPPQPSSPSSSTSTTPAQPSTPPPQPLPRPNNISTPPSRPTITIAGRTLPIFSVEHTLVDSGNAVALFGDRFLYGHNTPQVFQNLIHLPVGTVFTLTDRAGATKYQIAHREILTKSRTADFMGGIVTATFKSIPYDLSIMTCAGDPRPNQDATHRLILFATAI